MSTEASEKEHDKKTVTIIVNGRPKEVPKDDITYEQVVDLAFDNNPPTGENIVITVTYSKGEEGHKEGTLVPGDSVKAKDGMVFNVTATDKS